MPSRCEYTVLGAGGFIGRRVVRTLRASGVSCFAPVRGDPEVFTRDLGRVFFCLGVTADYATRPYDTVEAHATVLARVLQHATFSRLVYLSSTRLYDGTPGDLHREDDPLTFGARTLRDVFDHSKALGESLCRSAAAERTVVARVASVYDSEPGAEGFMSGLLSRLRSEREFTLPVASGSVRDYISLDDTVSILATLLDVAEPGTYNVASGENVSNQELVDALNQCGCNVSCADQTPRQTAGTLDISKIQRFGLAPAPIRGRVADLLRLSPHATR